MPAHVTTLLHSMYHFEEVKNIQISIISVIRQNYSWSLFIGVPISLWKTFNFCALYYSISPYICMCVTFSSSSGSSIHHISLQVEELEIHCALHTYWRNGLPSAPACVFNSAFLCIEVQLVTCIFIFLCNKWLILMHSANLLEFRVYQLHTYRSWMNTIHFHSLFPAEKPPVVGKGM